MYALPATPGTAHLHLAAAHSGTHLNPWQLLAGAAVITLVSYAAACVVTPFARCRHCDGNGKCRRPHGRAWHPCGRCKTSGRRLRWGRHLTNYLHRTRHHADRATHQRAHLTDRRWPR
jgi:hypothetical protein